MLAVEERDEVLQEELAQQEGRAVGWRDLAAPGVTIRGLQGLISSAFLKASAGNSLTSSIQPPGCGDLTRALVTSMFHQAGEQSPLSEELWSMYCCGVKTMSQGIGSSPGLPPFTCTRNLQEYPPVCDNSR